LILVDLICLSFDSLVKQDVTLGSYDCRFSSFVRAEP